MAYVLRNCSDAFRGTLASFLVLACLHSPSWAAETASQNLPFRSQWVHVPSVDESRDFYLDRSSVRVVEGDVEAWDVVIYKNPSQRDPSSGRLIKQKRTYRRSSCIRSDQALLKGSIFDEEGKLIELITQPYEKAPKVLIPYGTIAWSQLVLVCEIAGLPAPQLPGNGLKAPVSGVE